MLRQTPAAFRKSPLVTKDGSVKSPTKHKRVDSEQFIEPEENMNVSWLNGRGTWLAYILILGGVRLLLAFAPVSNYAQWTLLNTLSCVAHYMLIHHHTGVPWTETRLMQGKYDPLTFWESLDIRYDHHKRFLIIMPILVFLVTINSDSYPPSVPHLLLNTAMLSIALLPKYFQAARHKMKKGK